MANVKELEKRFSEKQREKEAAESALSAARSGLKAAKRELSQAREHLARHEAAGASEASSWSVRREWRAAKEVVAAAEGKLAVAREALSRAQDSADRVRDEAAHIQGELAGPRLEALRTQVAEELEALRADQATLREGHRRLVALNLAAKAAAPKRLVWRRAVDRFLLVAPRDPEQREAMGRSQQIPRVPPGFFHLEYFRAMSQSGPGGKFELLDGQDLTLPTEVEEQWNDGVLPAEIEAIERINLGFVVPPLNGGPPSAPAGRGKKGKAAVEKPVELNFETVAAEVEAAMREGRR